MKGNDKSRAALHQRLADELTAVKQYTIRSAMCDNRDNAKLHQDMSFGRKCSALSSGK